MMNMEPEAACNETTHTARMVRRLSTGLLNMSSVPTPLLSSVSLSMAALISEASLSTSAPTGRSQRSDSTPSSYRPDKMSHRGDSGMKNMQTAMMHGIT